MNGCPLPWSPWRGQSVRFQTWRKDKNTSSVSAPSTMAVWANPAKLPRPTWHETLSVSTKNKLRFCYWELLNWCRLVGWLCFMSPWQRGNLEMAPTFTVPYGGREARFLHRSHRESNPWLSCGSPLHYHCIKPAPQKIDVNAVTMICMQMMYTLLWLGHIKDHH